MEKKRRALVRGSHHTISRSRSLAAGSVILFLLIYLFIMLKPVVPYLDYLVRKDFIMENLCVNREQPEKQCNGKCHLEKQLRKEINGSEQDHAPPPPGIDREEFPKYPIVYTGGVPVVD